MKTSDVLNNPFCGLVLGILLTVLCQSSSTSTSIFITMVGSGLLTVGQAVYMIMGANVGTSITSTLVAFGNIERPKEFSLAMESAILGAAFNWVTIFILFPLEAAFNMLQVITEAITKNVNAGSVDGNDFDPIAVITEPIQKFILVINKEGLGNTSYTGSFVNVSFQNFFTLKSRKAVLGKN